MNEHENFIYFLEYNIQLKQCLYIYKNMTYVIFQANSSEFDKMRSLQNQITNYILYTRAYGNNTVLLNLNT